MTQNIDNWIRNLLPSETYSQALQKTYPWDSKSLTISNIVKSALYYLLIIPALTLDLIIGTTTSSIPRLIEKVIATKLASARDNFMKNPATFIKNNWKLLLFTIAIISAEIFVIYRRPSTEKPGTPLYHYLGVLGGIAIAMGIRLAPLLKEPHKSKPLALDSDPIPKAQRRPFKERFASFMHLKEQIQTFRAQIQKEQQKQKTKEGKANFQEVAKNLKRALKTHFSQTEIIRNPPIRQLIENLSTFSQYTKHTFSSCKKHIKTAQTILKKERSRMAHSPSQDLDRELPNAFGSYLLEIIL